MTLYSSGSYILWLACKPLACWFLQAQLKTLASICWCEPLTEVDASSLALATLLPKAQQHQPDTTTSHMSCRWTLEGFPRGPALLTYLHSQLMEADDQAAPLLQRWLRSAVAPYICHMRSWLFTTAVVMPGFGNAVRSEAGSCPAALDRLDRHKHIQVWHLPFACSDCPVLLPNQEVASNC